MRGGPAIFTVILTTIAATSVFGQTNICTAEVRVSASDKSGKPLNDLTEKSFIAKVDGEPVSLLSLDRSQTVRSILFLLDVSSSMVGKPTSSGPVGDSYRLPISNIERAIFDHLVKILPGPTTIGVLLFAKQSKVIFGFSPDKTTAIRTVSKYFDDNGDSKNGGKTEIQEAVSDAVDFLQKEHVEGDLILISDGISSSDDFVKGIDRKLISSRTRLYVHLIEPDIHGTPEEVGSLDELLHIVQESGGSEVMTRPSALSSNPQLPGLMNYRLLERIKSSRLFVLTYSSKRNGWHKLKLSPNERSTELDYPRELPPCTN